MIGRIADALYLSWSLIYWNLRKTKFRLGRGRTACPCQNPSDSGRGMETGCDAALPLRSPSRFRHVCPLLKRNGQGRWVCSANTPEVRPFWGRAVGVFGFSLAALALVVSLSAWGLLRWRGYPVSYAQIAWPPAWSEFHKVQSAFFAQRAQQDLARSDVPAALMSLSVSYQLDPANYAVGRLFARLSQSGQPALADSVYTQLVRDHPDKRAETLAAWYEALLWRGDFGGIATVARQALILDGARNPAWINALLFALRHEPNDALLRELATDLKSGPAARVFRLELQTREAPAQARLALMASDGPGDTNYLEYYRPKRLIELGHAQDALRLLAAGGSRVVSRDVVTLRLEAYQALGWRTLIRSELESIVTNQLTPTTAELIASFLVRHPDPDFLRTSFDAFKTRDWPRDETLYRTWAAWLCAAGASRDFARFQEATDQMRAITKSDLRVLKQVEAFFRGESASSRIESYLPAMQPLPLETTYALLERYYRPRVQAPPRP